MSFIYSNAQFCLISNHLVVFLAGGGTPGRAEVGVWAWAVSHMGPVKSGVVFNLDATAQAYSDPSIHSKVRDYMETVRALRGLDHNLSTEPLETEVIVRLG